MFWIFRAAKHLEECLGDKRYTNGLGYDTKNSPRVLMANLNQLKPTGKLFGTHQMKIYEVCRSPAFAKETHSNFHHPSPTVEDLIQIFSDLQHPFPNVYVTRNIALFRSPCRNCHDVQVAKALKAKNMKIKTNKRSGRFTGVTSAGMVRMTPKVQ